MRNLVSLLELAETQTEDCSDHDNDCQRLDVDRFRRTGVPEIVCADGRSAQQIAACMIRLHDTLGRALATRVSPGVAREITDQLPQARYDPSAQTLMVGVYPASSGTALVVSASPSDVQIASETAQCLQFLGVNVIGLTAPTISELVAAVDNCTDYEAIVMTIADQPQLVSIAAGLTDAPVVAVPVANGDAGNLDGISPLVVCLASCAPGVAVVNIDNGFGAAALVCKIIARKKDCCCSRDSNK